MIILSRTKSRIFPSPPQIDLTESKNLLIRILLLFKKPYLGRRASPNRQ